VKHLHGGISPFRGEILPAKESPCPDAGSGGSCANEVIHISILRETAMIHLLQREFVSQSIRNGTFRDFANLAGLLSQMSKKKG